MSLGSLSQEAHEKLSNMNRIGGKIQERGEDPKRFQKK
jgi:glutamate synthase domain-containing protein 2